MDGSVPERRKALVLTQQLVGLGGRKTSMVFMAETLAAQGWEVSVVTVQLSRLSMLKGNARLNAAPKTAWNIWRQVTPTLSSMVWVPAFHPARWPSALLNTLSMPLLHAYGALLPKSVLERAAKADLVIIESCSAVALFRTLHRVARKARFVYSMSDRLDVVGMHPGLSTMFRQDAAQYDLVRVPAQALLADAPGANAVLIPHAIDKAAFDAPTDNPFKTGQKDGPFKDGGKHAVLAGDMMFDAAAFTALVEAAPDVTFHVFGRVHPGPAADAANVVVHGEVPFQDLVAYIKHADAGLALYADKPGLDYLAQSSLKLIQYEYAGLPTVAPHFAVGDHGNVFGYDAGDASSQVAALRRALASPRPQTPDAIRDWNEMVRTLVAEAFKTTRAGVP